jgi:hypothetical protein
MSIIRGLVEPNRSASAEWDVQAVNIRLLGLVRYNFLDDEV